MEELLLDVMYDVPGQTDVSKVVIDDKVVRGEADPLVMYESEAKKASSRRLVTQSPHTKKAPGAGAFLVVVEQQTLHY